MGMSIIVVKYGVHYRWSLPTALTDQLRLGHELREELVAQHLVYEQAVKDVWSSYPQVAQVEAALAAAETAVERAAEAVSRRRVADRVKRVTGAEADALREARALVKRLRADRRDAITQVRVAAKPALDELNTANRDLKPLYAEFTGRGLYWATFNDVADHHRVAVRRVASDRAAGRPASLRHHRFDGSGTVAVQLAQASGAPRRSPEPLAQGENGRWRNVISVPWVDPVEWNGMSWSQQRAAGRVKVRMRVGAGVIEIPVQMHRMLSADADVTGARLTVRRVAGGFRCHLTVTAKVPEPVPVTEGPTVALHLGWRGDDDAVVVGSWRASSRLDIPADLRDVFTSDREGLTGQVRLPSSVVERLRAVDAVRSERDVAMNTVRDELVAWLAKVGPVAHPFRDGEVLSSADVARWRSPSRFASLARAWRDGLPDVDGAAKVADVLEAWRRADRLAWEGQEHGRAKVLGFRTDLYRQVAAVIADQAGVLVVDDVSVAGLAASSDIPGAGGDAVSYRRTVSAPGELRVAVVSACARDGVPVRSVSSAGLSRMHAGYGHQNPDDGRVVSRPVLCDGCGVSYDPDVSATVLMLARAGDPDRFVWQTAAS